MTFVVGVDGGGTRTRAVVVDADGREVARAESAGAVATAHAPHLAADAVAEAVRAAAHAAAVLLPVSSLWAGLAGAGAEVAARAVHDALEPVGLADRIVVGTDVEAAFQDAFPTGPGVLLIAGTGSIAWTRDGRGERSQVGGWGHLLGDEGSGYAIGLAGLRTLTHAHDGRAPATAMAAPLLAACGARTPVDLVAWVGQASKSEVASLAPLVAAAAADGDRAAGAIVEDAVHALLAHVEVAIRRSGTQGVEGSGGDGSGGDGSGSNGRGDVQVVLWGGLLADGGPLRSRMIDALDERGIRRVDRPIDPPMGAARLALEGLLAAD